MTTDTLSKHIGAVASSATAVTLPTQNQGYVTKTGILYGSTLENYKYCIIPHSEFSLGDVIRVVSRATPNVAVIARVNAARTAYSPEVLGTDVSSYKDYYYVVSCEDDLCLSSYIQVQSVEKIGNALSLATGKTGEKARLSSMCHGEVRDVTPANILAAPTEGSFVHINGSVVAYAHSKMSRPIMVTKGDVVWMRAQMTENFAAIAKVSGTEAAPVYTPLAGGHLPRDTEPSEYRYLVKENGLVVLSWYEGAGADPVAVDAKILRSFLSETLTEDEVDPSSAIVPQTSGNVLTTASFNGGPGASYLIDKAYTISAGTTVVVPDGSKLHYRGAGKITSLGSGSGEGKIKFQDTLLKGSVQNNVGLADGATLANSNVRTSWFCPSALSGATNAQRLDRLNELISILDCQTLDFDQDFDLDKMDLVGDEHLQHLALDGILLRSRIRYKGNGHIVRLNSAYTALSTRTRGNASQPGSNYDAVTNVEIYGFEFTINSASVYTESRNIYSILNLGSVKNVLVQGCHFNGWRGTAIIVNFIYDKDTDAEFHLGIKPEHTIATAENLMIKDCQFVCNQDVIQYVGNGITISNGQHIVIEDCEFTDINTTCNGNEAWPGPIDFEAEVKTVCVTFSDIVVRNNSFINCGNRASINLAGYATDENHIVDTYVGHIRIYDNDVTDTELGISITSLSPVVKAQSSIEIFNNRFQNIKKGAVVITDYSGTHIYSHLCNISLTDCTFTKALPSSAIIGDYTSLHSTIDYDDTCSFVGF